MKKRVAMLLLLSMLLSACGGTSEDLTAGYIPRTVEDTALLPEEDPINFAVRVFQNSVKEGENTLISPLSVYYALAMTANGAQGETLAQMEATLGASRDQMNSWLHEYLNALEKEDALYLANAIWFNTDRRFAPNHDFLQTNADYFGAGIHTAPFDASTVRDINSWVKKHTGGMIDGILDQIPDGALMYLVNALAFEAEWEQVYEKHQVADAVFTTEDGEAQAVELMYDEVGDYLETEKATGFIRYYKGRNYAFAALLPKEGVTVAQLVESLDGGALSALLAQPQNASVETAIPKFETESTLEMSDILRTMGMTYAFDADLADFSALGTSEAGNICISRVLHKTTISVGEQGTRAGAATMVEMNDGAMPPEELKTVQLDRPFVYMLIDCENNLPFFMGTCMEIEN